MTPCREWTGATTCKDKGRNYGVRRINGKKVLVHRWVMAQIHGWEALEGKSVMHICDNPPCYRFDHLKIGTHSDNMRDMISKDRRSEPLGDKRKNTKLSEEQVLEIFASTDARKMLAEKYSVSRVMIGKIQNGRSWSWLTNPGSEQSEKEAK